VGHSGCAVPEMTAQQRLTELSPGQALPAAIQDGVITVFDLTGSIRSCV
jgi:TusA-related sulfurtransferase